jgi:4,5-DOPA dioxygenase extradiol
MSAMNRRHALLVIGGAALAACSRAERAPAAEKRTAERAAQRMPVVFVAHGAPPLLDDEEWLGQLGGWARALPRPRSILVLSAHWDARPTAIGAIEKKPLVYDFHGFPDRYYRFQYPSPGAAELAARVREVLAARNIAHVDEPERGLDHGVYCPLAGMHPSADVPVLQLSLPGLDPKTLVAFGRALGPLADEGVLVMGSGFLTHNLRMMGQGIATWAKEFDHWAEETLAKRDIDALADFRARAPAAALAHPTHEHFAPVLVTVGAAAELGRTDVSFPITGFWNGMPFTKRSVQIA